MTTQKYIPKNRLQLIPNRFFKQINLKIFKSLLKIFPNLILKVKGFSALFLIKKKYIILYLKILRYNSSFLFNTLVDIIVIDYPWKKNRFYLNYIIRSSYYSKLINVVIKTSLRQNILSITSLFSSSSWVERECWDLFGIFFDLHKNLKRILTDYGFKGNPLKKDFPLMGYKEIILTHWTGYLHLKTINN